MSYTVFYTDVDQIIVGHCRSLYFCSRSLPSGSAMRDQLSGHLPSNGFRSVPTSPVPEEGKNQKFFCAFTLSYLIKPVKQSGECICPLAFMHH